MTKEKFMDYEAVRKSGVTNMFLISHVVALSDNLTKEDCLDIMKNYTEYKAKYLDKE